MYTYPGKGSLKEPWTNLCPRNTGVWHISTQKDEPRETLIFLLVPHVLLWEYLSRAIITQKLIYSQVWHLWSPRSRGWNLPVASLCHSNAGLRKNRKTCIEVAHLFIRQHPWVLTNSQYNEYCLGYPLDGSISPPLRPDLIPRAPISYSLAFALLGFPTDAIRHTHQSPQEDHEPKNPQSTHLRITHLKWKRPNKRRRCLKL